MSQPDDEDHLFDLIDTCVELSINCNHTKEEQLIEDVTDLELEYEDITHCLGEEENCQLLQEPFINNDHFIKTYTYEEQSTRCVLKQMIIPFTIAGFGSTFAGIVLNRIITRNVIFQSIPQLEIMVPAFIGLIGNIETTLASRLSTHANLGTLDSTEGLIELLNGNALVVLCQATLTGLFAALASIAISAFNATTRANITLDNCLLLCASSLCTSLIANILLAMLICSVVVTSRRFNVNPDNISTPVAASMGDVCSLSILAFISRTFHKYSNRMWLLALILLLLLLSPLLVYYARRNRYTRSVILTGWTAILGAVLVEQPGGMVMEKAFEKYKVMSTLQPLVNGIGSNLVGIQTSRMSTYLHSITPQGTLPESNPKYCVGFEFVFFSRDINARVARLLLLILLPAHLFFTTLIYHLQHHFHFTLTPTIPLILSYSTAILLQLVILLYIAYIAVFWAWSRSINPDNAAIPFTSALADLLGNCLLALAFTFLNAVGDPNATRNVTVSNTVLTNSYGYNSTAIA